MSKNKTSKNTIVSKSKSKKKQLMKEQAALLEAVNKAQGVIEFELDGIIITANENFLNVMGYTQEEVQGHHHRMFV
ncbi:MAG: PAS domain S-box protein, partial [Pirellulales bacterium]